MILFSLLLIFTACIGAQQDFDPLETNKESLRQNDADVVCVPRGTSPLIAWGDREEDTCIPWMPADEAERPRAIWEQPVCPPCRPSSGSPIIWRPIECAFVKLNPYGYILWEPYWDTRQTYGTRYEQFLLFPRPPLCDRFGNDINDHGKWHMTAMETRIGLGMEGPRWPCFKTDGLIEVDFRGISDATVLSCRLRHAFGRVVWDSGSLLFGQWWHPLFVLECFPHTIGYAIGAPMEPQARDPQLRFTQRWNWLELIAAAASQGDFASYGPFGQSVEYIRNSKQPNLHLQLRGYYGDQLVGVAADYKRLVPRLKSCLDVKVHEHIDSFIFEAYGSFISAPWSLRLKTFWGQNANDHILLSGFGVSTVNPETDARTYSNTASAGAWLDFSYLFWCDSMELGLFAGGTKNLGSHHSLYIDPVTKRPIIYALLGVAQNIDYVARVSSRYIYKKDPIRFGIEFEWIRASWGRPDHFGKVRNGVPVDNYRVLLALFYMF